MIVQNLKQEERDQFYNLMQQSNIYQMSQPCGNQNKIKLYVQFNKVNQKLFMSVDKKITISQLENVIGQFYYIAFPSEQKNDVSEQNTPIKATNIRFNDCIVFQNEIVEDILMNYDLITCDLINKNSQQKSIIFGKKSQNKRNKKINQKMEQKQINNEQKQVQVSKNEPQQNKKPDLNKQQNSNKNNNNFQPNNATQKNKNDHKDKPTLQQSNKSTVSNKPLEQFKPQETISKNADFFEQSIQKTQQEKQSHQEPLFEHKEQKVDSKPQVLHQKQAPQINKDPSNKSSIQLEDNKHTHNDKKVNLQKPKQHYIEDQNLKLQHNSIDSFQNANKSKPSEIIQAKENKISTEVIKKPDFKQKEVTKHEPQIDKQPIKAKEAFLQKKIESSSSSSSSSEEQNNQQEDIFSKDYPSLIRQQNSEKEINKKKEKMNLNVSKIKEESKKNYSLLDDISYDLEAFKNEKNGKKVEQKKKRTISFEANIYEEETSVNSSEDEDSEEEVNIKNKKSKENKFISKLAKQIQ